MERVIRLRDESTVFNLLPADVVPFGRRDSVKTRSPHPVSRASLERRASVLDALTHDPGLRRLFTVVPPAARTNRA